MFFKFHDTTTLHRTSNPLTRGNAVKKKTKNYLLSIVWTVLYVRYRIKKITTKNKKVCCNGDCSTELYLAPFVIFQFDFLSPHFFFFNNSTPTVRMYCTLLYWTYVFWSFVTSIRFLQHGTNVFTYVCIWLLSSRFNTIPTVCTYVSYIILYGSKKIFDIWNIQESFYWYLTSSYKTAHHWFQILHTVPYQWMSECRAWCR